MSRSAYHGTFTDGNGKVIASGTVTVYLAGTSTLADVYTSSSGGSSVNTVTTNSTDGSFVFYVDFDDYPLEQKFKLSLSKTGYTSKSYDNIQVFTDHPITGWYTGSTYYPEPSETDQGSSSSNVQTVNDVLTTVGSDEVTIVLRHTGDSSTTTYTFSTSESTPSTTKLIVEKGVRISIGAGVTLTINGSLEAGRYQIFSGSGSVSYGYGVNEIYPEWRGADPGGVTESGSAIMTTLTEADGKLVTTRGTYKTETLKSTSVTFDINLDGGGSTVFEGGDESNAGFYVAASMSFLKLRGIIFNGFGSSIVTLDSNTRTIGEVFIHNCQVKDSVGGFALHCLTTDVTFTNNIIDNISTSGSARGIACGYDSYANQDSEGRYVVSNNIFRSIVSTGASAEAHAIWLFGYQATITGNVIEDVSNASGSNKEGIYTMCRYTTITGNTLQDAGGDEAMIDVKGKARGVTSATQGYNIIVSNNILLATSAHRIGILLQTSDVLCEGNIIDGEFTDAPIYVDSEAGDSLTIAKNQITNVAGSYAIYVLSDLEDIIIKDNIITHITGSAGSQTQVIYVRPTAALEINDIDISGNHINDNSEYVGTANFNGIYIFLGATEDINRLTINNNVIHINVSSINAEGIGMYASSGCTVDSLRVAGNITDITASGATAYPFYLDSNSEDQISDVFIENNKFYGVTAHTGSTNIEVHHSGGFFTNVGASGTITDVLPPAIVGLQYTFLRSASQTYRVDPDGTDIIQGGGAGKYLELDTDGDLVVLRCLVSGTWAIVGGNGTYAYEA